MEETTKNIEKGLMYKTTISQYKKALANEFYLECILIDYCLLEDRLLDFFVKTKFGEIKNNKFSFIKNKKDAARKLLNDEKFELKTISHKIQLLKKIIEITISNEEVSTPFLKAIKTVLTRNKIALDLTENYFAQLNNWKNRRNKIIHNLLNMKLSELKNHKDLAEEGFQLFRVIDKCVTKINGKVDKELSKQLQKKK